MGAVEDITQQRGHNLIRERLVNVITRQFQHAGTVVAGGGRCVVIGLLAPKGGAVR